MSKFMIVSVKDFEASVQDALNFALEGGIVLIGGASGDNTCPPVMLLKPRDLQVSLTDSQGYIRWVEP